MWLTGASNQDKALEVVRNIEFLGAQAIAIQGDMSKLADIQHLFTEALNKFGHINIVIKTYVRNVALWLKNVKD